MRRDAEEEGDGAAVDVDPVLRCPEVADGGQGDPGERLVDLDQGEVADAHGGVAANRGLDGDTETLIALESMTCNVAHQSNDAKEGVQAFLQKREPRWTNS